MKGRPTVGGVERANDCAIPSLVHTAAARKMVGNSVGHRWPHEQQTPACSTSRVFEIVSCSLFFKCFSTPSHFTHYQPSGYTAAIQIHQLPATLVLIAVAVVITTPLSIQLFAHSLLPPTSSSASTGRLGQCAVATGLTMLLTSQRHLHGETHTSVPSSVRCIS